MTARIDICLCTFRRPALLLEALGSLASLDWPAGLDGRIIVVDNDDSPSAEKVVTAFARNSPFPILYHHTDGRNISVARNAALDLSDADLLAFLDDDERVSPAWLSEIHARMKETEADVVLGPVRALYSADAPEWMQATRPHATEPVFVGGRIRTGYTCNVLMDRRSPHLKGMKFDPALGRSGGEDSAFFTEIARRGGTIAFAEDAIVVEDVPADRASLSWLLLRRFRMGQTHGRVLCEGRGFAKRVSTAIVALAKVGYCLGSALLAFGSVPRRNLALMRGTLHAGTFAGALGLRPITLYGGQTKGTPA